MLHAALEAYAFVAYFYNMRKFWSDFDFVVFNSILIGPLSSVVYRTYNFPYNHKMVKELHKRFWSLDQKYPLHSKQLSIIRKHNVFLNTISTIVVVLLTICNFALLCTPFLLHYILNIPLQLPMPLLLIEIDHNTTVGFILNYIYQTITVSLCIGAFAVIQPLNIMYTGLVSCMAEILRSKVKEFEQISLMNERKTSRKLKAAFAELVEDHIEIFNVADDVEGLLSFQLFLDITSFSISVCIALFYARLRGWIPGYVLSLLVVFVGFLNHFLGELSSMQLEKLSFDVYSVSWYRMSISMQKSWLIFLQKSQTTQLFSCAGLKPVGIDTFSSVT
ncbi:uncharacterized protein LOC134835215 [Culicoides brevitarsis]|uniref:uncharacterized protein LOC134835215 n=1 Tax=Culicoides brevitarsis TaxID=469753 RepID=UPI00307BB05E